MGAGSEMIELDWLSDGPMVGMAMHVPSSTERRRVAVEVEKCIVECLPGFRREWRRSDVMVCRENMLVTRGCFLWCAAEGKVVLEVRPHIPSPVIVRWEMSLGEVSPPCLVCPVALSMPSAGRTPSDE